MSAFMLIRMLPLSMITAEGETPIDAEHFPDDNFRNFIAAGCDNETGVKIDTDGNGSLSDSEIAAVETMDIKSKDISNLN